MPDLKLAAPKGTVRVLETDNGELLIFKTKADGSNDGNPGIYLRDHGSGLEVVRGGDPGPGFKLADDGKVHIVGLTNPA
jgi:hypothetical protein